MTKGDLPEILVPFFKALASEKRQQMLFSVFNDKEEHNVSDVSRRLGIAPSTASEHLSILKRGGILESRKVEKEVYYSVNRESILRAMEYLQRALSEA